MLYKESKALHGRKPELSQWCRILQVTEALNASRRKPLHTFHRLQIVLEIWGHSLDCIAELESPYCHVDVSESK